MRTTATAGQSIKRVVKNMKEDETLRQQNILIIKKRYRILLVKMLISLILPAIVCIGGLFMMIFASESSLLFIGLALMCLGAAILIFMGIYFVEEYSAKLQTYRRYIKRSEDFDGELD